MKTTVQEEGLNLSSRHEFGNPDGYLNEFQFVVTMDVATVLGVIEEELYYYETADGYIQVCRKVEMCQPIIIAQFKVTSDPIISQLKDIIKAYIVKARFYIGYPKEASNGGLLSIDEFALILKELEDEFETNKAESLNNPPMLAPLFAKYGLDPYPYENDKRTWMARCPRCQKSYIIFWNDNLRWGCGRCSLQGIGEQHFKTAMQMVRNPTEENKKEYHINYLVTKLTWIKTEQERIDEIAKDIQSGELKYKEASDKDYNLIFELLYGIKLEEIEPEHYSFNYDEEDSDHNFYYATNVTLKSSDGFKLRYSLDWSEGHPLTGLAETPYSKIK